MARRRLDKQDDEAILARSRVTQMIDAIDPVDLVSSIKRAPSLRGMILGYVAEEMFEKHLPDAYPEIMPEHIIKHDDHDRSQNKSDRTVQHGGNAYRIQLKSIQTARIARDIGSGLLVAVVQNDASDRREIRLPSGVTVNTTCYKRGDYDILAVPLFPFTGEWDFAYKRNVDCRSTVSSAYSEDDRSHLLATTEVITWPLDDCWTNRLTDLIAEPQSATLIVDEGLPEPA